MWNFKKFISGLAAMAVAATAFVAVPISAGAATSEHTIVATTASWSEKDDFAGGDRMQETAIDEDSDEVTDYYKVSVTGNAKYNGVYGGSAYKTAGNISNTSAITRESGTVTVSQTIRFHNDSGNHVGIYYGDIGYSGGAGGRGFWALANMTYTASGAATDGGTGTLSVTVNGNDAENINITENVWYTVLITATYSENSNTAVSVVISTVDGTALPGGNLSKTTSNKYNLDTIAIAHSTKATDTCYVDTKDESIKVEDTKVETVTLKYLCDNTVIKSNDPVDVTALDRIKDENYTYSIAKYIVSADHTKLYGTNETVYTEKTAKLTEAPDAEINVSFTDKSTTKFDRYYLWEYDNGDAPAHSEAASNGKTNNSNSATITVPEDGYYYIEGNFISNNASGRTLTISASDSTTIELDNMNPTSYGTVSKTESDIYLNKDVTITFTVSNSASRIDHILLKRVKSYNVTKVETNATVLKDKDSAREGEIVTLSNLTPNEGYTNPTLRVTYNDGTETQTCTLTDKEDGTYEFTMPAYDVVVTASAESANIPVSSVTVNYTYQGEVIYTDTFDITDCYSTTWEQDNNKNYYAAKLSSAVIGDTVYVPFHKYIVRGNTLYKTTNNSDPYFGERITLSANTVVNKALALDSRASGTIELFEDFDRDTSQNAHIRASNMSGYNNTGYTSTKTLPAGVYTFIVYAQNKGRGSSVNVGDTKIFGIGDVNSNNGSWTDKAFNNVVVPSEGTLRFVAGGSNTIDCYDVIIAIKTGDIVNAAVDTATGRDHSIATSYSTENLAAASGNIITWKIDVPVGAKLKLNPGTATFSEKVGAADDNGHSTVITGFSLGVKCSTPNITGGNVSIGLIVDGLLAPGSSAIIAAVSSSDYMEAGEYTATTANSAEFDETAELWGVDYMLTMMYSDDELMEITGDIASDDEGSASDINDFIDMSDENIDSEAVVEME